MKSAQNKISSQLFVVGVSHQTASLKQRGSFALSNQMLDSLLKDATDADISIFPLSTCNRTELYAWVSDSQLLVDLLLKHTGAKNSLWQKVGWIKKGEDTMRHILRVASGLESKILGDFQISGQLKDAFEFARDRNSLNPQLTRLIQTAISASKRVKTETDLSKGSASVSFAATHLIKGWSHRRNRQNILLVGVGEVGKAICGNIPKHLPDANLTIINRSAQKARNLASRYELNVREWQQLEDEVRKNDVIILATGAQDWIVRASMVTQNQPQLFIDLSVPANIEPAIGKLTGKSLLNLDQLVEKTQDAIQKRYAEIPKAEEILELMLSDYLSWLQRRRYAPVLNDIKSSLSKLHESEIRHFVKNNPEADELQLTAMSDQLVKKITSRLAQFLYNSQEISPKEILKVKQILNS